MITVDREVDRYLTLLGSKIREKDFTQLEVQEALGWGQSYISQLVTRQKSLRLEQVLSILQAIGVEPRIFFGELYASAPRLGAGPYQAPSSALPHRELEQMRSMLQGLTELLVKRGLITQRGLSQAVAEQRAESE